MAPSKKVVETVFERTKNIKYLIGAHVPTSGGVPIAITHASNIGANSFALFLKNQKRWVSKPYEKSVIDDFHSECKAHSYDGLKDILPHASYLINLGNPEDDKRKQSYDAFLDDLKRCEQLGIGRYNLHPGSTVGKISREQSISYIAEGINSAHKETEFVTVVLENMAGHGNLIGATLEDLRDIIELVDDKQRVGVCIDTCHTFAAGYDISTREPFEAFWKQFEEIVGYRYLSGIHLNDSKAPLGSNRDLHENIGEGFLGLEAFRLLLNKPEVQGIPMVLETPHAEGDLSVHAHEVKLLEWLIGKGADDAEFVEKARALSAKGEPRRREQQEKMDKKKDKAVKGQSKLSFGKRKKAAEDADGVPNGKKGKALEI